MWKGIREFFNYNKKQRNGLLVLAGLALLIQVFLYVDDFWVKSDASDFTMFEKAIAEMTLEDSLQEVHSQISFFPFDPNTVTHQEMQELGLKERQISTINNYRDKGGKFRRAGDLERIYGIDSTWYQKAEPFITIASAEKRKGERQRVLVTPTAFNINRVSKTDLEKMGLREWQAKRIITYREKVRPFQSPQELYKVYGMDSALVSQLVPYINIDSADFTSKVRSESRKLVVIEINTADSVSLLSLPGIGPAYAKRIKKYRDKLGGFYIKEQLLEVYGMDEERYTKFEAWIQIDKSELKKLDINKATFKDLLRHPYLDYEVVKNIVNFREQVRPYKSVEELKQIELIDGVLFSKIANYLTITSP
jgi:DNA uptake protein ComE-like DNA-binding protein